MQLRYVEHVLKVQLRLFRARMHTMFDWLCMMCYDYSMLASSLHCPMQFDTAGQLHLLRLLCAVQHRLFVALLYTEHVYCKLQLHLPAKLHYEHLVQCLQYWILWCHMPAQHMYSKLQLAQSSPLRDLFDVLFVQCWIFRVYLPATSANST